MEANKLHDYSYQEVLLEDVLLIIDTSKTDRIYIENEIEQVMLEVHEKYPNKPWKYVIIKDKDGLYDAVCYCLEKHQAQFFPLDAGNICGAIKEMKDRNMCKLLCSDQKRN